MGQIVEMKKPRLGTGATRKTPTERIAPSARVVNIPGQYDCPRCGYIAVGEVAGRVTRSGRHEIITARCLRAECGLEFSRAYEMADADERARRGGWRA